MRRRGVACVTIEQSMPDDAIPPVAVDDDTGGRVGAQHLIDSGRRIAFGDPENVVHVEERWRASSMSSRPHDGASAHRSHPHIDDGWRASCHPGTRVAALERWPDATSAQMIWSPSVRFRRARCGESAPGDLAIMGYDDIGFAAQAAVPLTNGSQPAYGAGRTAAEILPQATMTGAEPAVHILFTPELVVPTRPEELRNKFPADWASKRLRQPLYLREQDHAMRGD